MFSPLQKQIKELSASFLPDIIAVRRYLHMHPELSFSETGTSDYICSLLDTYGIEYRRGIAGTGITGFIRGHHPERRLVALRADMDALPLEEKNEVPYRSQQPGVMHACGHDAHMASLLGCARILKRMENQLEGTVQLIFQPGEEKLPGGAIKMMEEGLFSERKPDIVIGQHVESTLEAGVLGFREGPYMASTDELYFIVHGKGGHGAMPQNNADPVIMASHIILALQQVVSRKADPLIPTVLSIGKVIAQGATNVIPDEVTMEGTFRTFNEKWRAEAHQHIRLIAENTAKALGGSCECTIVAGYPVLVNDETVTRKAREAASVYLGNDHIVLLPNKMTGEDFARFTQVYPSVFYRLGAMPSGRKTTPAPHTSFFDINEQSLLTGMGAMAWITCYLLNEP